MILFRIVHSDSLKSPLSARSHSGRFHLGENEARLTSYLSFDQATCQKEVSHHLGNVVPLRNMAALEYEVEVDAVVDLTRETERKKYGVTLDGLLAESYGMAQATAQRARAGGAQALIVPSARDPKAKNVVLFLENIDRKAIQKRGTKPLE